MTEQSDILIVEQKGAVAVLTMNRPKVLNVLDVHLADALVDAFAAIEKDERTRVVVLQGAGRSFMAGGDLGLFHADLDAAPETARKLIERFHTLLRLMKAMRQPVIAAVHGPIAGGGVGLALATDLVVASDDATFMSAYTKLGTNPDGGTTWSLARLIGQRRALDFVLFNDIMDADTALRIGMINRVVPRAALSETALQLAERLARESAATVGAVKRLVQAAATASYDEQLDAEKAGFVRAAGSADFREGIRAFFEKRPAKFS